MNKKLKPLTIFLSDDELVNFKSHFDDFLNMNYDDKIKEQEKEIERLNNIIKQKDNTLKELREYIELGMNFDSLGVYRTKKKLLEILDKGEDKQ